MDGLRELQLTELGILKEVLPILEANRILYFALGGTMLGAVRHQGFIPWDDDIDIGVPREDYERLILLQDQLPTHLQLTSYAEDPSYEKYFIRIVDKRIAVRSNRTVMEMTIPAWIDIFPLDGLPNRRVLRKLHEKRILFSRMLFNLSRFDEIVDTKRSNRPPHEKALIWCVQHFPLQKLVSWDAGFRIMDRTLKSCPYQSSDYNVNAMGAYRMREAFDKKVFGDGAFYPFEDIEIRGPVDYDAYLTQLYGDWRTPADMGHHCIVEIVRPEENNNKLEGDCRA